MKAKIIALSILTFAPTIGHAQRAKRASSNYRPPYGMAGCGLGSMAFEENTKEWQIMASLLNSVADLFWFYSASPSTAMSSGTSNCSERPREEAMLEKRVFIEANLATLSKEAAQGSGEHLTALADVFGCTEALGEFHALSQSKYDVLFGQRDAGQVLNQYLVEIHASDTLSDVCVRAPSI